MTFKRTLPVKDVYQRHTHMSEWVSVWLSGRIKDKYFDRGTVAPTNINEYVKKRFQTLLNFLSIMASQCQKQIKSERQNIDGIAKEIANFIKILL